MTPTTPPREIYDPWLTPPGTLGALGVPYVYGGGSLQGAPMDWPDGAMVKGCSIRGWDCSGFAQAALWAAGYLRCAAWKDLRAEDIALRCEKVAPLRARPGDLAFYGPPVGIEHVMVVCQAGYDGRRVMVVGASGGNSRTRGDKPSACVKIVPLHYRRDLVMVGRLRQEYWPEQEEQIA